VGENIAQEFNIKELTTGVSTKGGYVSGGYFCQLQAGDFIQTKKRVLLK